MINIVYEDNHLLVVIKPINMPSQKDDSNDPNLLDELKKYLVKKYNKKGAAYLGLVQRLDRPVGGLMVFAKTSKAASRLSEQIRQHNVKKEYHAVVCGKIDKYGTFTDYLLKDTQTNMVKIDKNGKEAVLDYELVSFKNNYSLVKINLKTGRSHQIRVQFSYHGFPLYGDQRYNEKAKVKQQIALYATKLTFSHPITKEELTFEINFPSTQPWDIF
ncbi:MAG: RluA family pseudouridine synthase [Bacilli bacterium]